MYEFGELIDARIELRKINNFPNDSICNQLIDYAADEYERSFVVSDTMVIEQLVLTNNCVTILVNKYDRQY